MARVNVPSGCELHLPEHLVTADLTIRISPEVLQESWTWDPLSLPPEKLPAAIRELLGAGKEKEAARFTEEQLRALNISEGPLKVLTQMVQREMVSHAEVKQIRSTFASEHELLLKKIAELEDRIQLAAVDPALWDGHPSHWAMWIGGCVVLTILAVVISVVMCKVWKHPIIARIRQVYLERCRRDRHERRRHRQAQRNAAQQRELRVLHDALEIPRLEEDLVPEEFDVPPRCAVSL
jgi:hypothetical protein